MSKRFHMWAVVLVMGVTTPSVATPMRGADGPFVSIADTTLGYRAGGIFDFTTFTLGAGATLRFDPQMGNVTLWSLGDIRIDGKIDATGISHLVLNAGEELVLNAGGGIVLSGLNSANSTSFIGNSSALSGGYDVTTSRAGGNLCLSLSGCDIPPVPGRLLPHPGALSLQPHSSIIRAVPEPATLGLVGLLLPFLAVFRPRAQRDYRSA